MTDIKIIHIVVDGLSVNELIKFLKNEISEGFIIFINKGVYTLNAKTDKDYTTTLPNHTTMFTSMSVGKHGITFNSYRPIHIRFDTIFDLLKRGGKTTAMYVGKDKFNMYKDKVDVYYLNETYPPTDTPSVVKKFIKDVGGADANSCNLKDYTFIHFLETDRAGHVNGWDSEEYKQRLADIDNGIRKIMKLVDIYKKMCNITVILTSDHGGHKKNHGDNTNPDNFNIPFFVYHNYKDNNGDDIYSINKHTRVEYPYNVNPPIDNKDQPIRSGDIGNLVAKLLLPEGNIIRESNINIKQDLII